jgi:GH15 family glucan-1,4-alpha-glucosidase
LRLNSRIALNVAQERGAQRLGGILAPAEVSDGRQEMGLYPVKARQQYRGYPANASSFRPGFSVYFFRIHFDATVWQRWTQPHAFESGRFAMPNLKDYSLIGNSRSAALASKHGSIDWCCLPEFHDPSLFAAILDENRGGHFSIAPADAYTSTQRYIPSTNVLQTVFTADSGTLILTDAFVAQTEEEKASALFPDHEILRILKCQAGHATVLVEFAPRLFYGKLAASLADEKKFGIKFSFGENVFFLQSTLEAGVVRIAEGKATARFELKEGDEVLFSLSCNSEGPAVILEIKITGRQRMTQTIEFWKNWARQGSYNGIYKEQVIRSALVLKLLSHAPSGAIIAAPTSSLPEEIGGERNWDYRYCWLRDASFTVRALLKLGFRGEAAAYMNWILHATQLTQPKLQIVYSVYGHARIKEQQIAWLDGFAGSRPVRIGNGAWNQFQLDVYGEVLDAFFSYSQVVRDFDRKTRRFLLGFGDMICAFWDAPDMGIWEIRSAPALHTHSKVMAWAGLDRLMRLAKKYNWKKGQLGKYEKVKAALQAQIMEQGYNHALQSFTGTLNGDAADASALVFPLVGFCKPTSAHMVSTIEHIRRRLSKNHFVYRYRQADDGLEGEEACFGICSFWLAESLAKAGKVQEAKEVFEAVLHTASPTGLLAEEIDPDSRAMLGNYPQGFTHIGLINAALSINEAQKTEEHHAA